MDPIDFEEIISILAIHGRPDLIEEFKEHTNIDLMPSDNESLSDSEGSAVDEEIKYNIDKDGFYSLT